MSQPSPTTERKPASVAGSVESNIRSVISLERSLEQQKTFVDRIADAIATFSGSMFFIVVHVAWFIVWFLINTGHFLHVKAFDPYPFILLAMIVSVEGVLLSTFVLMKQNLMQRKTDHRDQLNLQIDLLSEKEITKALQLLRAISARLEIKETEQDMELEEMSANTSVDQLGQRLQSSESEKQN